MFAAGRAPGRLWRPHPSELRVAPVGPEAALDSVEPGLQISHCCPTWGTGAGSDTPLACGHIISLPEPLPGPWGSWHLLRAGWASPTSQSQTCLILHRGRGWGGWSMWGSRGGS